MEFCKCKRSRVHKLQSKLQSGRWQPAWARGNQTIKPHPAASRMLVPGATAIQPNRLCDLYSITVICAVRATHIGLLHT